MKQLHLRVEILRGLFLYFTLKQFEIPSFHVPDFLAFESGLRVTDHF